LTPGNINTVNLGVSYDFGAVKVSTMYERDEVKNSATGTGYLLGVNVPVGAGEIRAAYSTYKVEIAGKSPYGNKLSLGYIHNLSKRTAMYAMLAHVNNRNGASQALNGAVTGVNAGSTGYDFGIRHTF
jgi:predicted porin